MTLSTTAPAGGSSVTLGSNNVSLTVPASVTVASGSTTATFSATAAATIASNQSATVTATLGSSSQTATISLLAPVLVSGVACSPTSLGQSAVSTCTVTLTQTAPAGGSSVTLGSNNVSLTVPASVTVASGATTATFSATAAASIASNQSATVTATLGSSSQTATISLLAPVLVSGVACSPTSLGQSAVSTCTVTLTQTAPAGGSSVTLGSNNVSLTVPASVTVASGATTATFSATAAASIASNQSATVTATLGSSSQTATISLLAPVLVSGVACSPTSLGQSAVSTCTVTLTQTAPAGGSSVTLGSNNASLTVPASVTVAAGATTATFSATAAASIASNQSATVTATLGSSSQTADHQSAGAGARLRGGLQSRRVWAERGEHLHGDADPDGSGRRIERHTGEQQHFAHRAGIGDGSGGSDDGDIQRDGGGLHRQQSERNCDGDPRQQFADSDHQSAGAGAGLGRSLQSRESRAERGEHLHGDADPDRSGRRIERDAGEQQRFAHRAGIGDGSGGSDDGNFQRDGGGHASQAIRAQL